MQYLLSPQPRDIGNRMQPAQMAILAAMLIWASAADGAEWARHVIDNTSSGADGVRLADINGDGQQDIATGWEEGGVVRIYLCPPSESVRNPWPMIQVGRVASPEDAVVADVDSDGYPDVVSCCEGNTRSVFVHWNPRSLQATLEPANDDKWETDVFPQMQGRHRWMFCQPMYGSSGQVSELAVASKGRGGEIGLLIPPRAGDRRELAAWQWKRLSQTGWTMSVQAHDIDRDGLIDIVYSDRREQNRGVHWLKRPRQQFEDWPRVQLGGHDREVMFMDIGDMNSDDRIDIISAARHSRMLALLGPEPTGNSWTPINIDYPDNVGTGKGVAIGDIDNDSVPDLVCTCEQSKNKIGVYWLSQQPVARGQWMFHDISGPHEGIKFDRVELLDLDEDGDLDVLTCEERDNLGVIWYENPHNSSTESRRR